MKRITGIIMATVLAVFSLDALAQGRASIGIGDIEFRAMDSAGNKNRSAYGGNQVQDDTAAFVDMVSTALVKTQKFKVVERDRVDAIMAEQSGIASGGANPNFDFSGADWVDYILLGSITEYGSREQQASGVKFGFASEVARMAVDIRVLNTATGAIEIADTISSEVRGSTAIATGQFQTGGDQSEGDTLGRVMRQTAQGAVNLIVTHIYPIRVVSVSAEGIAMLNYGSSVLQAEDILNIYELGEEFIDPDTGEVLGRDEKHVGTIRVTEAQERFSKAVATDEGQTIPTQNVMARIAKNAPESGAKPTRGRKLFNR